MIASPFHHSVNVLLPPFMEEAGIIVFTLAHRPNIEWLIQYEQTQSIAGIQKRRGRWVVRCTYGVEPCGLQKFHSSFFRSIKCCRPKNPVVVMDTSARKFDGSPVEQQPFFD